MAETFYKKIRDYMAAGQAGIWLVMKQEEVALATLREVGASFKTPFGVSKWTITRGLELPGDGGEVIEDYRDPYAFAAAFRKDASPVPTMQANQMGSIVAAIDFQLILKGAGKDDAILLRGVKETVTRCRMDGNHFVIISPTVSIPEEWQPFFVVVEQDVPTREEMADHLYFWAISTLYPRLTKELPDRIKLFVEAVSKVRGWKGEESSGGFTVKRKGKPSIRIMIDREIYLTPDAKEWNQTSDLREIQAAISRHQIDQDTEDKILDASRGLTLEDAEKAFAVSYARHDEVRPFDILDEKSQAFKRSGAAKFLAREAITSVGGLEYAKEWIQKRAGAYGPKAKEFGLPAPKGVLLLGPPGTGKTQIAKAFASILDWALLIFDVSTAKNSLVGESEKAMTGLLRMCEDASPIVLLIDEVEKLIPSSSAQASSSVDTSMLSILLTWMSEKTAPVLLVATANKVSDLPPELLRKGRFDEIFWVDLPTSSARQEIFKIHLEKRDRDPQELNLRLVELVAATDGYTGAEIEGAIIEEMYNAFSEGRTITQSGLLAAIETTVPLSTLAGEKIEESRKWAKGRTRPASAPETKKEKRARVMKR